MSASLGVQGIVGKRLNTQFGTTSMYCFSSSYLFMPMLTIVAVVLTTVWVELVSDPRLFRLRQHVITRDHRLIAAVSLFIGAFVGRVILQKIGTAGTLGVGVGFRILSCFTWLFVPTKRGQERNSPPPTTAE